MNALNTTPAITNITINSNDDLEFVANGRLYVLLVEQQHLDNAFGQTAPYWENPYTGQGYNDIESELTLATWNTLKISEADALEVIQANATSWDDVTECTDKGLAMLAAQAAEQRKNARRNLLSHIVSTANRLRSTLRDMSLAMHVAWTRAKVLATGIVNFVKVADVDADGEIPVHTRRVASLESAGFIAVGTAPKKDHKDILKFIDLSKFESWIESGMDRIDAAKRSIISMHVWQIVAAGANA